jgi:hypothetical protein
MLHGVGTSTLQGSADWRAVKTKEELNRLHDVVAPQVAAMVVQWMNTYNRMHTSVPLVLRPGLGADDVQ